MTSCKKAIEIRCKFLHIANEGITNDEELALYYSAYALMLQDYYPNMSNSDVIKYWKKSAQCGGETAKEYLKDLGY